VNSGLSLVPRFHKVKQLRSRLKLWEAQIANEGETDGGREQRGERKEWKRGREKREGGRDGGRLGGIVGKVGREGDSHETRGTFRTTASQLLDNQRETFMRIPISLGYQPRGGPLKQYGGPAGTLGAQPAFLAGAQHNRNLKKASESAGEDIAQRCSLTRGTWCQNYLLQEPIPTKVSILLHELLTCHTKKTSVLCVHNVEEKG
jgi:hypothetical protein